MVLQKLTPCELLFPFQLSAELTVAIGQIWPTSDRILHGKPISEGFIKVQVDNVIEGCEKMPLLELTKTEDIKCVGDMLHCFVQWPREALKVNSIFNSLYFCILINTLLFLLNFRVWTKRHP